MFNTDALKKRYSLVRVDNRTCDKCGFLVKAKNGKVRCILSCQCRLVGDTKEHIVKKITQVLIKETGSNGICIPYERTILWEEIAEKIIEFLGVDK